MLIPTWVLEGLNEKVVISYKKNKIKQSLSVGMHLTAMIYLLPWLLPRAEASPSVYSPPQNIPPTGSLGVLILPYLSPQRDLGQRDLCEMHTF